MGFDLTTIDVLVRFGCRSAGGDRGFCFLREQGAADPRSELFRVTLGGQEDEGWLATGS